MKKIKDKNVDIKTAQDIGIIDNAEAALLAEAQAAAQRVIAVDDFEASDIAGLSKEREQMPRSAAKPRRVASA